ncbi:NAD binding domain of 6-phosphogluconate dehydrogenase family protein, partial [Vibrio parahaemolyticus V-223/04]
WVRLWLRTYSKRA